MFFSLLREEDQTFQRMVKNGMKSGRQEGSVLIFSLHSQPNKLWTIMLHVLTDKLCHIL